MTKTLIEIQTAAQKADWSVHLDRQQMNEALEFITSTWNAAIEAAEGVVPVESRAQDRYARGHNMCRTETLKNLSNLKKL